MNAPYFIGPDVLENGIARLEALQLHHVEALWAIASTEPELWTYTTMPMYSRADFDQYIADALNERTNGTAWPFAIVDVKTGKVAGSTRYGDIHQLHRRVHIGWTWISRQFQGTGLNPAMKHLMINHALRTLPGLRVELRADSRNQRSRAAMEKLGAHFEGISRRHMVLPDGSIRDTLNFSYIADEWPAIEAKFFPQFCQ